MEISNNSISTLQTSVGTIATTVEQTVQTQTTQPILSGNSVNVTESTDFEKLLAQLEEEKKDKERESAEVQLSAAMKSITGAAEQLAQDQQVALVELQMATETLEHLVENYRTTDEERAAKIAEKEQLEKEGKTEEAAKLETEIAALDQELETNLQAQETAKKAIDTATGKLTADSLSVLSAMIRPMAKDVTSDENADPDKKKVVLTVADVFFQHMEKTLQDMQVELDRKRVQMV